MRLAVLVALERLVGIVEDLEDPALLALLLLLFLEALEVELRVRGPPLAHPGRMPDGYLRVPATIRYSRSWAIPPPGAAYSVSKNRAQVSASSRRRSGSRPSASVFVGP